MADFPNLRFSSPSFNNDRNNPFFIFGENSIQQLLELKNSGKQKGRFGPEYPFGYTPQTAFYVNPDKTYLSSPNGPEIPVEYGISLAFKSNNDNFISDPNTKNNQKKIVLENFEDQRTKDFVHKLDQNRVIPTDPGTSTKEIYLGSFISTNTENEDPTILGFDLIIDRINSPLFNGAINDFITQFSSISEVSSRRQIYNDFLIQFNKFFNFNVSGENLPNSESKKTYYLKKVSGINRLMEQNTSSDFKKSFVAYNTDKIKLTLMEDVSQSMGYLSSLYKALSWSRLNGKQVIPPNLLRFNINIVVSEVRNFNRVVKFRTNNGEALRVYSDLLSKYTYTLYDCQFYFPSMPHGDLVNIEVQSGTTLTDYDIEFDFKFSSMKFEKFNFDLVNRTGDDITVTSDFIDNKLTNPKLITPLDTNRFSSNGFTIETLPKSITKQSYAQYDAATKRYIFGNTKFEGFNADTINALKQRAKTEDSIRPLTRLRNDLIRAGAFALNRKIITQAALLNKTLDKIRNTLPFASRMSEPTNVYKSQQLSLRTDVINAARNFVGRSIRSFFTPPEE